MKTKGKRNNGPPRRSILLFLFLCIGLITAIIYFILIHERENFRNYDFIDNFYRGTVTATAGEIDIDSILSNPAGSDFPKSLYKSIVQIFTGTRDSTATGRSKRWMHHQFSDGAFRIVFESLVERPAEDLIVRLRIKDERNFYRLRIDLSSDLPIVIEKIENGATSLICRTAAGSMNYHAAREESKKRIIHIVYLGKNLLIYEEDKIIFYKSCFDDLNPGYAAAEMSSEQLLKEVTVKYSGLRKEESRQLMDQLTKVLPPDDKGRFYWNKYYPEHNVMVADKLSPYLQRIKIGEETRRSILLPVGSAISWDIEIPSQSLLELSFALVDKHPLDPAKTRFVINLADSEDRILKRFDYFLTDEELAMKMWKNIRIPLNDLSGAQCRMEFRAVSVEPETGSESRIVTIWGNPILRQLRRFGDINVLLISLDTLRADHLSCYGYGRKTTPYIDMLTEKGILFENTISTSSWTLPSHMSIFSGLYPSECGYRQIRDSKRINHAQVSRLEQEITTLSEVLKSNDYQTVAFTGGAYLAPTFGFDQGFDLYSETGQLFYKDAEREVSEVIQWLKDNGKNKFFLFYHTYEIHPPYKRRFFKAEGGECRDRIVANYDSGILFADRQLGRLFNELKTLGISDKTLVIITSDHGENFDDPYLTKDRGKHGLTLYDCELKVPLIFSLEGKLPRGLRIKNQIRSVDIFPTILDILDIKTDSETRGRSLVPLMQKENEKGRVSFAEAIHLYESYTWDRYAIRTDRYKVIKNIPDKWHPDVKDYEIYDISKDPNEKSSLNAFNRSTIDALKEMLDRIISDLNEIARKLSSNALKKARDYPELMKQLRALGYLGAN